MKYEIETQQIAYDERANVEAAAAMTRGLLATWRSRFSLAEPDAAIAQNYGDLAIASDSPTKVHARVVTEEDVRTYEYDIESGLISLDITAPEDQPLDTFQPDVVSILDGLSKAIFSGDAIERRGR